MIDKSIRGREHLRSYIHFLEIEKNASTNTIASYKLDLERYLQYLEKKNITSLEKIKERDISGFLSLLYDIGLSASSVSRNLSAIKMFHRFLVRDGVTENNPTENVDTPKLEKQLPDVLSW